MIEKNKHSGVIICYNNTKLEGVFRSLLTWAVFHSAWNIDRMCVADTQD